MKVQLTQKNEKSFELYRQKEEQNFPREPLSYVIHKIVAQGLLYVCTMAGFKKYCPETLWNFHLAALIKVATHRVELHNFNFNLSSNDNTLSYSIVFNINT